MWPEIPVRTKFRLYPWLLLLAGLSLLSQAGGLPRPAEAAADPSPRGLGPSRAAKTEIPSRYLRLYQKACRRGEVWTTRDGRRYACWAVLAAVGMVESRHGTVAGSKRGGSSSAGALGPMQFMPGTWPGYGSGDVFDPANAIPAARRYLLANNARKNVGWALAAYNAGPGRADNPPAMTRRYVKNVRALARHYQKGT